MAVSPHPLVGRIIDAMSGGPRVESDGERCVIAVKVVPGASRDELAGLLGEAIKLRVAAPPEGGKANRAVCKLLAEALGVSRKAVSVVAGTSQPRKRIAIEGLSPDEVRQRLGRSLK
jgi:uncharacterized protein (TIGR00251 family)